jgi:hypothetical protein
VQLQKLQGLRRRLRLSAGFSGSTLALMSSMTQAEMKARTRDFAVQIIGVCLSLENDDLGRLVRPNSFDPVLV